MQDFMEFLRTRRTYRRFQQKAVPAAVVDDILEAARIASCGANRQTLKYLVVQSPEQVDKVNGLVHWAAYLPPEQGTPKPEERPTLFVAVCRDTALPGGISSSYNEASHTISFFGTPTVAGKYTLELSTYGNPVNNPSEIIIFNIIGEDKITTVAQYHFDETAGTSAANTVYGQAVADGFTPGWGNGYMGNAIDLSTATVESSRLVQPTYAELNTLADQSFTIALWVKGEKANQCLLDIEGDNGSYIRIEGDNLLRFTICDGTNETQLSARIMPNLFNNEWNQLICVRDREDGKLYLYLNGERRAQIDDKCGNLEISSITIGNREENGTYLPFRGMMDELRISTGAMNERQVKEYYNDPTAGINNIEVGNSGIKVYPTHFTHEVQIDFNGDLIGATTITLCNNAGSVVFEREYHLNGLPRLIIGGFDGLPQGAYILRIANSNLVESYKLFKQ